VNELIKLCCELLAVDVDENAFALCDVCIYLECRAFGEICKACRRNCCSGSNMGSLNGDRGF